MKPQPTTTSCHFLQVQRRGNSEFHHELAKRSRLQCLDPPIPVSRNVSVLCSTEDLKPGITQVHEAVLLLLASESSVGNFFERVKIKQVFCTSRTASFASVCFASLCN